MANFAHVPAAARRIVLDKARAFRAGAKYRVITGGRISDDAYDVCVDDAAKVMAAEIRRTTRMEIPPRALSPFLWRAASVGAKYAHRD